MLSARKLLSRVNLLGLLVMAALLALWQISIQTGIVSFNFLPSPVEIAQGGWELIVANELWPNLLHTLVITLIGWFVAVLVGLSLGLLLGLSTTVWGYSMATVEVLRALPAIAFVPVAVLIFGYSPSMELVIIIYVAQWPVLINTIDGVRNVSQGLLDVATVFRMSRFNRIWKFVLPAALPLIVVGWRLALTVALILAVVSEMVGNPAGLGHGLIFQQDALNADKMFAYVITIGLLGVFLNMCFTMLVRLLPGAARFEGSDK